MLGALSIIFAFGIIIFIHELGHFVSALLMKIKVEKFAFGFGPELVGVTYKDTRYAICAIPLGGMVKLAGEYEAETKGNDDEFYQKPWYKRIFVVINGPLMNYALAIVFFFLSIYIWGLGVPSELPIVGEIRPGYPAEKAGIKSGDVVLEINGKKIKMWQDIAQYIHANADKEIKIKIKRANEISDIKITPQLEKDMKIGVVGIMPEIRTQKAGFFKSAGISIAHTIDINIIFFAYMWNKIVKWEKPEVAGPIGIAQIVVQTSKSGFSSLLILIGRISVMVGIMNLLPIPIFDGGYILLFLIEGLITHKKVDSKIIEKMNMVGLSFIIILMIYAFYSDFDRLGVITFVHDKLNLFFHHLGFK
ncbi:MAG: RIP metalloprotease RseP [Elusimicrobia bacterium RIFOXYA2_FULL_39_19]|nr:MAG: RIP metalloprotease RseP [Elusimicrobia bacterium RIFOXYA2_FULL_39_19]